MAAPPQTHYDVLGLARDADAVEVRSAWKLHVQVWHPDRFTGDMRDEAERRAARINEAYTTLRDSSRRAAYDCRLAADDRDGQRTQSQVRASTRQRTVVPRGAATPVGTPVALPETPSLSEQIDAVAVELVRAVRRHPRTLAAAAACFVLLVGGGVVLQAATGPSLPADATLAAAAVSRADRIAPSDTIDLEALAEQSSRDAAHQDAQLARQMREDEAALRAQDAADAAANAAAARAAAKAPRRANASGAAATSPPRRIVRVMPSLPPR